jgi:hypothetical protein
MMRATARILMLATTALAITGCARPLQYLVSPVSSEYVEGKLDGQWMQRVITGERGEIAHIELLYCPTLPNVSTVCRTAIVWENGTSLLYDMAHQGNAPQAPAPPVVIAPAATLQGSSIAVPAPLAH